MIVDATCAPSNVKYPQDTELLNEARENTEAMIDGIHDSKKGKRPRTYRKLAHKNYLKFARSKKHTGKLIRKSVRQQLGYLKRNPGVIDQMLSKGKLLSEKQQKRLETIRTLYEQQKTMYDSKVHSKKLEYADICDRVEVERKFSLAKRKCGLGLIMTKLRITTEHVVAMSILLLNLKKVLDTFLRSLLDLLLVSLSLQNLPLFS